MKPRILVVDDEARMAAVVSAALERAGYECETAGDGESALAALDARGADALVTDWKMPGMDGLELLRRARERRPGLPVILLTAHGTVPTAVAAMREGAFDYVIKPFDNDELRACVARAVSLTRLERENRWLRQEVSSRYAPDAVVAESARGKETLELIRRVAPSKATVLIQGESGTGKELVARLLHYWSERVGRPFVAVNCKAFAEGVLESELFGHERGAFTGATTPRSGCFEQADGGTLFLDEVGDLPADVQAKLLRVLQEGEFERVGSSHTRKVDTRVIAATHHHLESLVKEGRFRADLYYRLNVFPIALPALRERPDDIPRLVWFFVNRRQRALNRRFTTIPPAVMDSLQRHPWPGNVRELQNVVERAMIHSTSEVLLLDDGPGQEPSSASSMSGTLEEVERHHIENALRRCRWRINGPGNAAEVLGLHPNTLRFRMKKLGIQRPAESGVVRDFKRPA